MNPAGAPWEDLLSDASEKVMSAIATISKTSDRTRYLGRGASGDMTLVADKVAEEAILGALRQVEEVEILSEEAGHVGPDSSRVTAVIDPLDGSSNYRKGI